MNWFRFYSEAARDVKVTILATTMDVKFPEALGVWAILLSLASDSPIRGRLMLTEIRPWKAAELAATTGEANIQAWLDQMVELGMVDFDGTAYGITHWEKRQYVSDDVTERTRKFREKQAPPPSQAVPAQATENVSGTLQERFANAPDTETESEAETETEREIAPSPSAPANPSPHRKHLALRTEPAVISFRDCCHFWPDDETARIISEKVGRDPPRVARWKETVTTWKLRGNRLGNIVGQLDWFEKGIPPAYNGHGADSATGPVEEDVPWYQKTDEYKAMKARVLKGTNDANPEKEGPTIHGQPAAADPAAGRPGPGRHLRPPLHQA